MKNILFKIPYTGMLEELISLVNRINECVSEKNNYEILISANREDETIYNKEALLLLKPNIELGNIVLCFGNRESEIDVVNRDMDIDYDYDIIVCFTNDVYVLQYGFDDKIRKEYTEKYPNGNGFMYSMVEGVSSRGVIVMDKKYYTKKGYIVKVTNANNLIVNYYTDKNNERQEELNYCILENIKNEYIDNIVIISNSDDYKKLSLICESSQKIIPIITDVRPTYNDYFLIITKLFNNKNNTNIICNLDIIIPEETLKDNLLSNYLKNEGTCLALSRWDVLDIKSKTCVHFDREDSQDTWIFKGGVPNINGADFTLGIAGCDNVVAYLLEQSGYNVINPSKTLKTFHFHLTNIHNYTDIVGNVIERLQPPYKLIQPTE